MTKSIVELPLEIIIMILDRVHYNILMQIQLTHPIVYSIISQYFRYITLKAINKFPDLKTYKNTNLIESIYYLNNYIHRGISRIIVCNNNLCQKLDGKWNFITNNISNGAVKYHEQKWITAGCSHRLYGPAKTIWYINGPKKSECWYKHRNKHSDNGPAETIWDFNGIKRAEYWYKDNKMLRENGPAVIWWYPNSIKNYELWYGKTIVRNDNDINDNDINYNDINPNDSNNYYENGTLEKNIDINKHEFWYRNGREHRENGPAETIWNTKGTKISECWNINGREHRENGPTEIIWNTKGIKLHERWFKYGQCHRKKHPADTCWESDGYIERWFTNGVLRKKKRLT